MPDVVEWIVLSPAVPLDRCRAARGDRRGAGRFNQGYELNDLVLKRSSSSVAKQGQRRIDHASPEDEYRGRDSAERVFWRPRISLPHPRPFGKTGYR